ncbi:FAD/NAD(P)-binding protein [Corallincola platygyrae]|uniref:FAD/NAD(P)-binding protein n=1 Tax=Corallincola platygyrae TaxID=1193278 RepID=A0ABW4XJL6_9GAMM
MMADPWLPMLAEVIENQPEVPGVATLALRLVDDQQRQEYRFQWGQFNMLYLKGVGEIPISIMDCEGDHILHTIRAVGRVSNRMVELQSGDHMGLRGPFGNHWPLEGTEQRDLVFITAGLGCAPVLAAIRQAILQRQRFNRIVILQGVKHRHDLLWETQYQAWRDVPDCQVLLAASEEHAHIPHWSMGMVTVLLEQAEFDINHCTVMMCGPEPMLRASMQKLLEMGVDPQHCFLSLERNMQCGFGHCGHCQMGDQFLCRQGPIFPYSRIQRWLETRGI